MSLVRVLGQPFLARFDHPSGRRVGLFMHAPRDESSAPTSPYAHRRRLPQM